MVKIYQVYYSQNQLAKCEFAPYLNANCTEFFENSVIAELVGADTEASWLGVLSWNFREKIRAPLAPHSHKCTAKADDIISILKHETSADVYGFVKYNYHFPLSHFCGVHPHLQTHFNNVMYRLGYKKLPKGPDHAFYCNHFVATRSVYQFYVNRWLVPAMEIMKSMPELWSDSGYPRKLPDGLLKKFGVSFYPYHTFVLERLFSYFVYFNDLKVKYL